MVAVAYVVVVRAYFVQWKGFVTIPLLVRIHAKVKEKNAAPCVALIAACATREKPVLQAPVSR